MFRTTCLLEKNRVSNDPRSFSKNLPWIEGCLDWLCTREMSMEGILQGELERQSCLEAQKCSNLANQVINIH